MTESQNQAHDRDATSSAQRPSPDAKVDSLVREFFEEKGREVELTEEKRRRRAARRPLITALALVFCAAVWILPSFLITPPTPPSDTELEQGMRVATYLVALDVSAFHSANGRLPETLAEAGVDENFLSYSKASDSLYELLTTWNGRDIRYHSAMSRQEFLGSAAALLERR